MHERGRPSAMMIGPRRSARRSGPHLLAAVALVSCACVSALGQKADVAPSANRDRVATLLAVNDVYRIEGLEGGSIGGLSRVRALRRELERASPDLLVLHGGDFLFPSFASRMYRGEQMISSLNALDGDPVGFDARMFVVFGNHEFDRGRMADAASLDTRIEGSQFRWLGGNITFANGSDGSPLVASRKLTRTAQVESGGIRIGIFGLTIPTLGVEYIADFAGEQATARALSAELRAQNAEVIVALTHLNAANDRLLLETLGEAGPDLVIGGHDHEAMAIQIRDRWLLKADADARSATVVRLTKRGDGSLLVVPELRKLGGDSPRPDPDLQTLVNGWQMRHAQAFCAQVGGSPDCLNEVYGRTRTDLGAEENKIRGSETSLGDWVTDRMLEAFKSCGAQVAFLNSGSLRINRDLPGGTTITRRHVEELFAYPTPLHLLRIDGSTLMKVADQSVRGWPGSGSWLQVAGFGFRHHTKERAAADLTWLPSESARPVASGDSVLAVTGDYLINPDIGDQDGYQMLNRSQIVTDCAINGLDLKALVIKDLKGAEPEGIAPRVLGRICQGVPGVPCLVPSNAG